MFEVRCTSLTLKVFLLFTKTITLHAFSKLITSNVEEELYFDEPDDGSTIDNFDDDIAHTPAPTAFDTHDDYDDDDAPIPYGFVVILILIVLGCFIFGCIIRKPKKKENKENKEKMYIQMSDGNGTIYLQEIQR